MQRTLSSMFGRGKTASPAKSSPSKKDSSMVEEPSTKKQRTSSALSSSSSSSSTTTTTTTTSNSPPTLTNEAIIDMLNKLAHAEYANGERAKMLVYKKAASAIKNHPTQITSGAEAMKLKGIGKKIGAKIDELAASGTIQRVERDANNPIHELASISGIGPVMAKNLVEQKGINSLDDLKTAVKQGRVALSTAARVGLMYDEEIRLRIPRSEAVAISEYVQEIAAKIDPDLKCTLVGSLRRGAESGGDIDFLCSHPSYTSKSPGAMDGSTRDGTGGKLLKLTAELSRRGLIIETITNGPKKTMAVIRLPPSIPIPGDDQPPPKGAGWRNEATGKRLVRRMDLRLHPYDVYAAGLLHWTGSDVFNVKLRGKAKELSMHLSEYGLCPVGSTGQQGPPLDAPDEATLLAYLGMDYVEPADR